MKIFKNEQDSSFQNPVLSTDVHMDDVFRKQIQKTDQLPDSVLFPCLQETS